MSKTSASYFVLLRTYIYNLLKTLHISAHYILLLHLAA